MHLPDAAGGCEERWGTVSISVIIPTLNAERELPELLEKIKAQRLEPMGTDPIGTLPNCVQTPMVSEIIVVDSESTDRTVAIAEEAGARVLSVARKDFDHGRTRDLALRASSGHVVVFLTQDAVPVNEFFLENLIRLLSEEKVAVVTGRQLPKADASPMEKLIREFNYPAESHIRSEEDVDRMGIKAFFCSDVCAAYNRQNYLELGGFDYPLKTNEDMFFAAKAIRNGYRVGYAADALVYHSHNFSLKEQYQRNYIQGYEIEKHRELLGEVSQESEGMRLVKFVSAGLLRKGRIVSFIHFGLDCCARLLGSRAGRKKYLSEIQAR